MIALAATVLAGCGSGGGSDAPEAFLAFSSTFAPFRSWTSFHSDGRPMTARSRRTCWPAHPVHQRATAARRVRVPGRHGDRRGARERQPEVFALRAISPTSAAAQWYLPSAFQTEIEIGLADRLELGLYLTFVPDPGEQLASKALLPGAGNGLKQRLRYILADPRAWPVDVGVYGELVETNARSSSRPSS